MNARSPKANLKVSSAPFQTDAPHEVAVKARFPSSEPIPTARNGLFCQRNPIPETPVKSRFFRHEPPKAPRNGLSRQRNLTCAIPARSKGFSDWSCCRRQEIGLCRQMDVRVVLWLYSEFFTGLRKQHIMYTMKTKFYIAIALSAVLLAASCSSGSDSESGTSASTPETISDTTAAVLSETVTTTSAPLGNVEEETSVVVPFTAANGSGTVAVSGDNSPVVAWFGGLPGEVSLDLVDADVNDAASVVEELVSFWFFQDDDSGDVPPSIFESASGDISDSVGTRYVVEAQGLPPAPVAETTTTTSSTSTTTTSSVPETSEPPSSATSSTTTTTASSTTTTTTTVVESSAVLQVQVLNGSGVAGAAGRMTDKLSQAGYVVLSPENAPQRYSSSAVYFAEGWQDKAEEILQAAEIEEIDAPTAMPQQFASEDAAVIVLLGTDTAPVVVRDQAGLRPRQRNDVQLPLPDSVPRDRYVPGLANINIYSQINDQGSLDLQAKLDELAIFMRYVGNYQPYVGATAANRDTNGTFREVAKLIEDTLLWMGFTPQNVCGAPAGYSFTDLLQPTREWSEEFKVYRGDAIFTTDRLLELHGGERINPESNLDFYIREAVQTAYDMLRLPELLDETESPQLVLCAVWLAPSGEVPEFSNAAWYALLTPGIQPQESLLSQGTYHLKEISKNGNMAYVLVCHPTLGSRYIDLAWRDGGYRAEIVGNLLNIGCQADFEDRGYIADYEPEETIKFSFGERVFSASDLLGFPRN